MEIDLTYVFKSTNGDEKGMRERIIDEDKFGNPKRDEKGYPLIKFGMPLTLRKVCVNSLDMVGEKENITGEERYKRGRLIASLMEAKETIELSIEDIALLRKLIGQSSNPYIVFQAFQILDQPKKE